MMYGTIGREIAANKIRFLTAGWILSGLNKSKFSGRRMFTHYFSKCY